MIRKFLITIVYILLLTACHQKDTCNDKCTINYVKEIDKINSEVSE